MKNTNENSISTLNDLVEICKDGQQGFQTAAKDAKDADLAQTFNHYAAQRTQYMTELQRQIRNLGGDPDRHGTVSGTLHRGWINLKAALTSDEPHAVLVECERGEDAAVKSYREALAKTDLDPETRSLIQRQYESVIAAHDRIRNLRDSGVHATR